MDKRTSFLPVAAVLVAAAVGASSGLYIKGLSLSSFALAGCRMGVPCLLVLPFIVRRRALLGPAGHRGSLWLASALTAVRLLLFILAYKLTAIGNAVVLLYLWPVFALTIDCFRLRARPTPAELGLLAASFGGVVVMNLHRNFALSPNDLLGSLFMIVSAFLFAVTIIIFKKALSQKVSELDTMYFQNVVGAVVFLPFLLMELPAVPAAHTALGVLYGALIGLVGFGLYFYGMKRLPLFQYSAFSYSEVPFGVLLGVVFAHEGVTPNQLVGAAVIVAASFAAQRLRTVKAA